MGKLGYSVDFDADSMLRGFVFSMLRTSMLRTSMLRGIGRLAYGEAREWEIREKRKEGFLADWRGSGRRWTQIF
jgi:hypothetical protein